MRAIMVAVLLTGCSSTIAPGTRFANAAGPIGEYSVPVQSVEERKFSGVVRQQYDFSCGSAALATLLRFHYGDRVTEAQIFQGMWRDGDRDAIRRVGFSLLDMKRYLTARRLNADGYKVTLAQVAETNVPGIALINVNGYKHFVVVKGVSAAEVLLGDPAVGLHPVPRADFEKSWNGVYFVINDYQDQARKAFNRPTAWAAYTRSPLSGRFSDPVSQQALSLTAPFYGDF